MAADEIWIASGFTPVRYEAGEEVPWQVGAYFLDTASGVVQGWTCPELRVCHPYHLSPSNRFVLSGLYLHDRATGRTRTLVNVIEIAAGHHLIGWGEGHDERLLIRPLTLSPTTQYVVVNTTFEPLARVGHIGRGFFGLHVGRHVTATPDGHLWILDLESSLDPAGVPIIERPLPGDLRWPEEGVAVMSVGEGGVALLARGDGESVRVVRYSWDGALLSDASIASLPITDGLSVSPDGRRIAAVTFPAPSSSDWLRSRGMAVSIFDATSGEEMLRITGASTSPTALWGEVPVSAPLTSYSMWWNQAGWLADSSGVLVGTVHGERLVTLDGSWEEVVGRPAPDDTDLFAHVVDNEARITDRAGRSLASVRFTDPVPVYGSEPHIAIAWGDHSRELRVVLAHVAKQHSFRAPPTPPLTAVIEHPPFEDRLKVEVIAEDCAVLRRNPAFASEVRICLKHGSVAEVDDFVRDWIHVRTIYGFKGWMHATDLRWHSSGVWLPE